MKRLWRWVLNGLAMVSLLLCIAAGTVWVRSYWVADQFFWVRESTEPVLNQDRKTINCSDGGVQIWHMHVEYPGTTPNPGEIGHWFTYQTNPPFGYPYLIVGIKAWEWQSRTDIQIKGFEITYDKEDKARVQSATFPLGMIFLVALLLTAIRVRQEIKRRRRFRKGHCPGCGYDLRATPERCPECGMIPAKAT